MKKVLYIFLITVVYNCSSENTDRVENPLSENEDQWVLPNGAITGSFNLFPLAQNPKLSNVIDVSFLSDDALVAMINFNGEIRVYPYEYISPFESINDIINGVPFAMSYCPLTKSAICWDTTFNKEQFVLRASGYLLNDNVVLYDSESDTYWSQMFVKSIKGKYVGQTNSTFNSIETTWSTVKTYFSEATVFTNSSISNKTTNKKTKNTSSNIKDNKKSYGIINPKVKSNSEILLFNYDEFKDETKIFTNRVIAQNIIIIGNQENHFITSYINDSNAIFTPLQNSFPIIMEDSNGNKWDVFGIAKEGIRKGEQLKSPVSFVALWWAWEAFYDDFIFNE